MAVIMVVEDDPGFMTGCRSEIEALGHETVACESAEDALDVVGTRAFDAVVVDLILPGSDGAEFIRALRANPQTRDMPVIAFTWVKTMGLALDESDKLWLPADVVIDKSEGTGAVARALAALLASTGVRERDSGAIG